MRKLWRITPHGIPARTHPFFTLPPELRGMQLYRFRAGDLHQGSAFQMKACRTAQLERLRESQNEGAPAPAAVTPTLPNSFVHQCGTLLGFPASSRQKCGFAETRQEATQESWSTEVAICKVGRDLEPKGGLPNLVTALDDQAAVVFEPNLQDLRALLCVLYDSACERCKGSATVVGELS